MADLIPGIFGVIAIFAKFDKKNFNGIMPSIPKVA